MHLFLGTAQDVVEVVGLPNDSTLLFEAQPLHQGQSLAEAGVCAETELQITEQAKWREDYSDCYVLNGNHVKRNSKVRGVWKMQLFLDQVVESGQKVEQKFKVSNSICKFGEIQLGVNICDKDSGETADDAENFILPESPYDYTATLIVDLEKEAERIMILLINGVEKERMPLEDLRRYGPDSYGYKVFIIFDENVEVDLL